MLGQDYAHYLGLALPQASERTCSQGARGSGDQVLLSTGQAHDVGAGLAGSGDRNAEPDIATEEGMGG